MSARANLSRRPPGSACAFAVAKAVLVAITLSAASNGRPSDVPPSALLAAYVVLGADGQMLARAIVSSAACPDVMVDGLAQPMRTRAAPGTPPRRPNQTIASAFPVRVCEATLAPTAARASIGDRTLPLARAAPQRIVVIGDTGCRLKRSEQAYQDCSDPDAWPFPAVAEAAAKERPDLVVHVGDYHYRESACPLTRGCANSAWGYGWSAWNADLFAPAQGLLAAAPWVVARGNHEECARAGQGWFRMLDAGPFTPLRSCDGSENDGSADFSDPYAVPLGDNWQLVVFDSAMASRPLDLSRPSDVLALDRYQENMRLVAALAAVPSMHTIFVGHHPVLGLSPDRRSGVTMGNQLLLAAMVPSSGTRYFPAGVELALHGHVHLFEAISFSSPQPATIVSGHGGDNLEVPLPEPLPARLGSVEGVTVDFVAHARSFGYLVMDRRPDGWVLRAQSLAGSTLVVCTLVNARLSCAKHGLLNPAAELSAIPADDR
ncbi:conserved exported hypothetical protein [Burkholderiales bacterium]|nr:conserved exported hypothetical protein [Burkholderiales bacterium]